MPCLHLVVGPWGSGKTTLVPHLRALLPECVVFDWDCIIPGLSSTAGTDVHTDATTWEGLRLTWLSIVEAVTGGGWDVVLLGPRGPEAFAGLEGAWIRTANLDCPDDVLAARLEERGETEEDIHDELAAAAILRESRYHPIPVTGKEPREVAGAIADWVRQDRDRAD